MTTANSAMLTPAFRAAKLREAQALLRSRGELTAAGTWRRSIRVPADVDRRLAEIRADATADRRRRLEQLTAEVARPVATPSVGRRYDPQGRLRYIDWSVGQVVVPTGRLRR
jgi:hypothetical protein